MPRTITEKQSEYLFESMFGYLNGFHDIGEEEYPKLSVEELAEYGYGTIAFEKDTDPTYQSIYFCGKDAIMEKCRSLIAEEPEFSDCCYDWQEQ